MTVESNVTSYRAVVVVVVGALIATDSFNSSLQSRELCTQRSSG